MVRIRVSADDFATFFKNKKKRCRSWTPTSLFFSLGQLAAFPFAAGFEWQLAPNGCKKKVHFAPWKLFLKKGNPADRGPNKFTHPQAAPHANCCGPQLPALGLPLVRSQSYDLSPNYPGITGSSPMRSDFLIAWGSGG